MFELDNLELDLDEHLQDGPFRFKPSTHSSTKTKNEINLLKGKLPSALELFSGNEPFTFKPSQLSDISPISKPNRNNVHTTLDLIYSPDKKRKRTDELDLSHDRGSSSPNCFLSSEGKGTSDTPKSNQRPQVRQRKFPGPAGILPDKPLSTLNELKLPFDIDPEVKEKPDVVLCSQTSDSIFNEAPYQQMVQDFGLNKNSTLTQFTIDWILQKKLCKKSDLKIPFLAAIVQNINCSSKEAEISLRDKSGIINGILHRDVWHEMGGIIQPGATIVLKQVGVISLRGHACLNISHKTILTVYNMVEHELDVHKVNPFTSLELMKSIQDWRTRDTPDSPARTNTNVTLNNKTTTSMFSSVNQTPLFSSLIQPSGRLPVHSSSPSFISKNKFQGGTEKSKTGERANGLNKFNTLTRAQPVTVSLSSSKCITRNLNNSNSLTVPNASYKDQTQIPSTCNFDIGFDMDDDFENEEPVNHPRTETPLKYPNNNNSQNLTHDESRILEEVLDGIDFEDFS